MWCAYLLDGNSLEEVIRVTFTYDNLRNFIWKWTTIFRPVPDIPSSFRSTVRSAGYNHAYCIPSISQSTFQSIAYQSNAFLIGWHPSSFCTVSTKSTAYFPIPCELSSPIHFSPAPMFPSVLCDPYVRWVYCKSMTPTHQFIASPSVQWVPCSSMHKLQFTEYPLVPFTLLVHWILSSSLLTFQSTALIQSTANNRINRVPTNSLCIHPSSACVPEVYFEPIAHYKPSRPLQTLLSTVYPPVNYCVPSSPLQILLSFTYHPVH